MTGWSASLCPQLSVSSKARLPPLDISPVLHDFLPRTSESVRAWSLYILREDYFVYKNEKQLWVSEKYIETAR